RIAGLERRAFDMTVPQQQRFELVEVALDIREHERALDLDRDDGLVAPVEHQDAEPALVASGAPRLAAALERLPAVLEERRVAQDVAAILGGDDVVSDAGGDERFGAGIMRRIAAAPVNVAVVGFERRFEQDGLDLVIDQHGEPLGQIPAYIRPGLRMPLGSKPSLTRFVNAASAASCGSNTSTAARKAAGARTSVACPPQVLTACRTSAAAASSARANST